MSIKVTQLPDAERRDRHVAIGTFDGVHLGHREVIGDADTVLTFEPHPVSVLSPQAAPKLIMPFEIKRDVLVDRLGATRVSVGENFRFGARARGDTEMLAGREEFETRVVPLLDIEGETVSSSRIRALIAAGEVDLATKLLGAPFLTEGEVVEGDKRGRTLGFPTANLVPEDAMAVPGHGVYAAFANGHPAAVNVGVRPMFETGRGLLIEVFLIDWEGDLYGRTLRVAFLERLRGERRFPSVEDLISQMHRDVEQAREVCASFTAP